MTINLLEYLKTFFVEFQDIELKNKDGFVLSFSIAEKQDKLDEYGRLVADYVEALEIAQSFVNVDEFKNFDTVEELEAKLQGWLYLEKLIAEGLYMLGTLRGLEVLNEVG